MLEKLRSYGLGLSLFVVLAGVALYVYVSLGGDSPFSGEGALQATDFTTLAHSQADDAFLLCAPELCEAATPDGPAVILAASLADARRAVASLEIGQPLIVLRETNFATSQFEFLERMRASPLAAVISIRLTAVEPGPYEVDPPPRTTLHIYGHQPLGDSSKSEHAERVLAWIDRITSLLGRS